MGWHDLAGTLSSQARHDHIVLDVANQALLQDGVEVRNAYARMLATDFATTVQEEDLRARPEPSARVINRWVADHTGGHIKGLLTPAQVQGASALLVDAVYMEAPWATGFARSKTVAAPFYVTASTRETIPTMTSPATLTAPASVSPSLDAAELAYRGDALSALVLMPPLGQLAKFEADLTPAVLAQIVRCLVDQRVSVKLPRFSLDSKLGLNAVLSAMGMNQAFSPEADFANLSPQPVQLGLVLQDAQIKVGESGTEASAASGGGLVPTAVAPEKVLNIAFDHPFAFLVRDNATGTIVFEAQVSDPATS